jgi:diacylglycerol kinase
MLKLLKSFTYAFAGVKTCYISETNFKIHLLLAVIVIFLGVGLTISTTEWMIVFFCISFVLALEMINTAIEKLCNMVHAAVHPAIKKVKDIAAGSVLVAAMGSAITGGIIFLPKIIIYIKAF